MVKIEKDGAVVAGVDAPMKLLKGTQGSFDLQPDPASLRDLASRLRDDAALTKDPLEKERFLASAADADRRAVSSELSALWTTPLR